uniref:Uncharacterized protein n=1 Tax=Rangifer tarandus platyrhynchus TaxID=3082113 RepID=A0ACB0F3G3_RANTA|nr:unnamed protein product [Rangifer tarandus platyrhynchus]
MARCGPQCRILKGAERPKDRTRIRGTKRSHGHGTGLGYRSSGVFSANSLNFTRRWSEPGRGEGTRGLPRAVPWEAGGESGRGVQAEGAAHAVKDALQSPAWSSRLRAENLTAAGEHARPSSSFTAPHGARGMRGAAAGPCPALSGPALRAPSPGFRAVSIALRPARSREAGLPVRQPPPYPQRPLPAPSPLFHLQPPPPPSALRVGLSRQRNHRDNTAPSTALDPAGSAL